MSRSDNWPREVELEPVTVTIPRQWVNRLQALCSADLETVADVLFELLDHAQQGVYRPGSWERPWLCQALGYEWTANVEPDPDQPMFERPRRSVPP
jgi:hypothetical protein